MTNYPALALERGKNEGELIPGAEEGMEASIPVSPGDYSFQKEWLPAPPKKATGEGRFDPPFLSPGDQGETTGAAFPWNPPRAIPPEGGMARAAYGVTTPGLEGEEILTGRILAPEGKARRVRAEGWEESAALPLLTAVRRAQEGADFVRGNRRSFALTLPETGTGTAGWTVDDLDRAVERDTRRYDGPSTFY